MDLPRSAGVLLHPRSLPHGRLDGAARAFVDWLADTGFGWWQVLPLAPPDAAGSPYASPSGMAIDPALVAWPAAPLAEERLRTFRERESFWIDLHAARFGQASVAAQARADGEWAAVRAHAAERGVRILGDLPIYVARDGVEHRAFPELFLPDVEAGCPPDAFTDDGQHWDNPVYDWPAMAADGHRLFVERLRRALRLADMVRVDHFRGFAGFWAIPAGAALARDGSWLPGPGEAPFRAAQAALGDLPLVAEDLGVVTDDVHALRERLGLPGMRVVQFAYDSDGGNPHLVQHHPEWCVAYAGTHDNDTVAGWWAALADWQRDRFTASLVDAGLAGRDPVTGMLELVLGSRARLAVLTAQDLLGLGSEARMNHPGTVDGNWRWRLPADWRERVDAEWLRDALRRTGRAAGRERPPAEAFPGTARA